MPDLARYLTGAWHLTRLGWDRGSGRALRLQGHAHFVACETGFRFEEHGTAAIGAYRGEAARRYLFRLRGPGDADVCFEDGTFFHHLDLATGSARVCHVCAPDRYDGRYRVLGPDCWLLTWQVTGPRKRHRIASRFVRARAADGRDGLDATGAGVYPAAP